MASSLKTLEYCLKFRSHSISKSFFGSCLRSSVRFQHSLNSNPSSKLPQNELDLSKISDIDKIKNEVQYPPIKPKYPPGKWGQMDHKYAWLWNDAKENQLNILDVQERINALVEKEMSAIQLEPINDHPASLQFRQYVTKTVVRPWEEVPVYRDVLAEEDISSVVSRLGKDISDFLMMEHEILNRRNSESETHQTQLCQHLIRLISNCLISRLGIKFPHLNTCQYDENVLVRSLWDRHGLERKRRRFTSDSDILLFDTVQDQRFISEGYFQAMLRSPHPLPQCVPQDEGISVSSDAPQLHFRPSVYGHEKAQKKKIDSVVAGHRLGDPCEFGLVGILSTQDTHSVEERIGAQTARECRQALGLTMTFSWLAAQAINQGFSHLVDLTYPLTSQTVLTDGKVFSFMAYQLNTLELWKDNEANSVVNLCWHSEEMPLYHSVTDGKVNGLNEEVLVNLVKMFTLTPSERGYDMKPTISQRSQVDDNKQDYVPKRVIVEEIVEEEQYIVS